MRRHSARQATRSTLALWAAAAMCLPTPASALPPQGRAAGTPTHAARTAGKSSKGRSSQADVTFTGYRSLPGDRGVVFVELSTPVAVEVKRTGQVIEYKLLGARVPLRNNRNPLLLRDFVSSAERAVLVSDKEAVRLVVTLRDPVAPSHRMLARGKGAVLEVELPAPPAR